ncbi:BTAD domain-containing putative transcriptional regulator [Streptomyces sannanensis]|uniref:BTAD domain-containing putative transcriptional regulator n=1 Tax=Streptomyces sannanensis TaxID=285536 RepID=A0ABP6SA36_9ACTN
MTGAGMTVWFGVLGTIAAWRDGVPADVGHAQQQRVLAALLVDAGNAVPADVLVDRAWGEAPPRRGREALYGYVSRLRRVLSQMCATDIERTPAGYRLTVDPHRVDMHQFRDLTSRARGQGDAGQAAALWEKALGLWRGEAFTGIDTPWFDSRRDLLDRERLTAELDLADARLRLGQHDRILVELLARAEAQPLDERVAGQLMLALYRGGRGADALTHYQSIRGRLVEELGTDPGPALRLLHQRILGADPALDLAPGPGVAVDEAAAVRPVPRQLPAPPATFIGRDRELASLDGLLKEPADDRAVVVISAIGGVGGMGKTWLALRWAHEHLDRFPDGQLYADLCGFDPSSEPMPPGMVLRGFLDALGIDTQEMPADPEALAALYRSLVAGRRMLIMLDNARGADQIRPLLPGSATCTVMVTSRSHLSGLTATHGCQYLDLGTLPDDDARQILVHALGHDRVAAEPDAVSGLLRRCAGLPLALGIVAARAAARPDFPLTVLTSELHDAACRLDALNAGDLATDLRAVFDTSYRVLDHSTAQTFALLGLAPGPDISLSAAARLTALPAPRARVLLRTLESAHLVQQNIPGRYRMHNLVRLYATERGHDLPDDVRQAALHRLVGFNATTALACDRLLSPQRTPLAGPRTASAVGALHVEDVDAAMAWFEAEHLCLLAVHRFALEHGLHAQAWQLAWALDTFQWRRGWLLDRITTLRSTLPALEVLEEPASMALAHRLLARARIPLDQHAEALEHLRRAIALYERAGDRAGQAQTHLNFALAWERHGDHAEALSHAVRNLRFREVLGDPHREAEALNAVGWYHAHLGHHDQARDYCERALALCRRHAFLEGEAFTLDSLGYIAHHSGSHAQALDHYGRALTLRRRLGDQYEEADALACMGDVYRATDRPADAHDVLSRAFDLYRGQHRATEARRAQRLLEELKPALPARASDGAESGTVPDVAHRTA